MATEGGTAGEWACGACTLLNASTLRLCSLCGTPKVQLLHVPCHISPLLPAPRLSSPPSSPFSSSLLAHAQPSPCRRRRRHHRLRPVLPFSADGVAFRCPLPPHTSIAYICPHGCAASPDGRGQSCAFQAAWQDEWQRLVVHQANRHVRVTRSRSPLPHRVRVLPLTSAVARFPTRTMPTLTMPPLRFDRPSALPAKKSKRTPAGQGATSGQPAKGAGRASSSSAATPVLRRASSSSASRPSRDPPDTSWPVSRRRYPKPS